MIIKHMMNIKQFSTTLILLIDYNANTSAYDLYQICKKRSGVGI